MSASTSRPVWDSCKVLTPTADNTTNQSRRGNVAMNTTTLESVTLREFTIHNSAANVAAQRVQVEYGSGSAKLVALIGHK